jgi:outer membrane immunogenic protein
MKIVTIGIAAIAAALCTPASAADMAVKAPQTVPESASVSGWSGFYVGGNAGYGWHDPTVSFSANDPAAAFATCGGLVGGTCPPSASFNIDGGLGGLQAGYNWHVGQSWLLGFETDFNWSGVRGTASSSFMLQDFPSNFETSEDIKWFGTVRGRLGYLPANNILIYGTGGLAYGRVNDNVMLNSPPASNNGLEEFPFSYDCSGISNCFVGSSSRTMIGWTAGVGLEYALWQNVTAKVEYLYVNLGSARVNVIAQSIIPLSGTAPSSFTANYGTVDFNLIRAGLNYQF